MSAVVEPTCGESARETSNRFLARVNGFWLLITLLSLVAAGKVIQADSMDPDAFWHLRVADQLAGDGIRPLVDSISFASLKTPWTPYSWLAELFMRAVWNLGGFQLATLITALCSAMIVLVTASSPPPLEGGGGGRGPGRTFDDQGLIESDSTLEPLPLTPRSRGGGKELSITLLTANAAFFTLPFISFRPVTFALLIFAIIVALLSHDRAAPSKRTWLIVPLTALMTNMHLYALLVPILLLATTAGAFFDDRKQFARYALLTFATAVAACCTPMLGGAITTALRYNAVDPMVAANYITEMRPFYSGGIGKVSLALFIALLTMCIIRRRTLQITDWLWLAMATLLLFRLGRFSPVFAILSMPTFAKAFPPLEGKALERGIVKLAMLAIIAISLLNFLPSLVDRDFDRWLNRNTPSYPTAAAQFIDANITPRTGHLINEFNWGGYLAWRLGDRWQVLMDGRTQLYAPAFWNATHLGTPATRLELLKTITADAAVVPASDSCLAKPLEQLGWKTVYRDDLAIVMTPDSLSR